MNDKPNPDMSGIAVVVSSGVKIHSVCTKCSLTRSRYRDKLLSLYDFQSTKSLNTSLILNSNHLSSFP